jgi:hypothetical protein
LNPVVLPSPWQHDDIGSVDWAGSASLNNGLFGISGAGLDIGANQDSFHYIYQPLNNDKTIVARVASIPNPPNTSVKAGVMIRESLEPGARNAMFLVLGGSGASLQWRATTGDASSGLSGDQGATAPYWVKLVRGGSRFAGYQSADGANWTLAGLCDVPMSASGYIGLALTSHDPRTLASAVFDSVQITSDSDNNGLADSWELTYFSQIGLDPNSTAPRADGLTIGQAFARQLNPVDFYNGVAPAIAKISGDNQTGSPESFLAQPLTVCVSGSAGVIQNAPVRFETVDGQGGLVTNPGQPTTSLSLLALTGTDGIARAYLKLPSTSGTDATVNVSPGSGTNGCNVSFVEHSLSSTALVCPVTTGMVLRLAADQGVITGSNGLVPCSEISFAT